MIKTLLTCRGLKKEPRIHVGTAHSRFNTGYTERFTPRDLALLWPKVDLIIDHLHRKRFKSIFIFNLNDIMDIIEIEHGYNTANLNEKISL